jgi:hypothetical protein
MAGSGLAYQLGQSLEIIVLRTQRSLGQLIHNTAPTASTRLTPPKRGHAFEKRQMVERLRATLESVATRLLADAGRASSLRALPMTVAVLGLLTHARLSMVHLRAPQHSAAGIAPINPKYR